MRSPLALCLLVATACTDSRGEGADPLAPDASVAVEGLAIAADQAALHITWGEDRALAFTATAQLSDGRRVDVSADAVFGADRPVVRFDGPTLHTQGTGAGRVTVRATYGGHEASFDLVVYLDKARIGAGAPDDAADLFAQATPGTNWGYLVYPDDGTLVPRNLEHAEVHWVDHQHDLFALSIKAEFVDLTVYLPDSADYGTFAELEAAEWHLLSDAHPGGELAIGVRALRRADPASYGELPGRTIRISEDAVKGGVYFWSTSGTDGAGSGVYRFDMAAPGAVVEPFYTAANSPHGRCVGCHAISRDGRRMAVTFDKPNGGATVVDVATRTALLEVNPVGAPDAYAWNFAAFDPTGDHVLTTLRGAMVLRESDTGTIVATVPSAHASHPDFAPDGKAIVYVTADTECTRSGRVWAGWQDACFYDGRIVMRSYDPTDQSFGPMTVLADPVGRNSFYPSISPDGAWVLYNQSSEDAYDNASAELFAVATDGTRRPFRVDEPNRGAGLTNSWPRWAPFEQTLDGERVFWFTFSSRRAFGVRQGAGYPQIWMAPFFPDRAAAGLPASGPGFRLPFQALFSNNHIAQWTERVHQVE